MNDKEEIKRKVISEITKEVLSEEVLNYLFASVSSTIDKILSNDNQLTSIKEDLQAELLISFNNLKVQINTSLGELRDECSYRHDDCIKQIWFLQKDIERLNSMVQYLMNKSHEG